MEVESSKASFLFYKLLTFLVHANVISLEMLWVPVYQFTVLHEKKKCHSPNLFQTDPSLSLLMSQDAVGQNL